MTFDEAAQKLRNLPNKLANDQVYDFRVHQFLDGGFLLERVFRALTRRSNCLQSRCSRVNLMRNSTLDFISRRNFGFLPSVYLRVQLLIAYGLYKQATVGDNTTSQPWKIQVTEYSKWKAWSVTVMLLSREEVFGPMNKKE